MFGRPSFGVSQPSTFGFGSGASTSFGQPNQLFGNTSSTFGTGSSGFGSTSQPIFGSPQQTATPLFGSTTAPAFGQSNQTSGFGASLFSNSQQPSTSSGIFGSSASTSFGQQSKPSGFGFPSSSSSGLFGQSTQPPQQNASSMFQPPPSGALFGSSTSFGETQTQSGTVNKFVPVTGTDSVQKSGVVQSINTKHYCITCMKEYENKSLEELRWEDYQANRKGQQQPSFGGPSQPFGITSSNSTLFGQAEIKPAFGQSSTAFGQPSFGISSQTTTPSMFGKPSTAFGNTSTTNSFTFGTGTPTTTLFGPNTAAKPFAATTNPPLFGSTQPQQNNFGSTMFGQPSAQTSTTNLFAKPTQQPGFMGQSTFQFGSQPQNQTNVFQNTKPNMTGFNIFGQPNTTTSSFGQGQQQSTFTPFNSFGKPTQPAFGQTTQSTFGTGLPTSSIFGNNTSKSLFALGTNLFGNTFQPNTGFNLPSQQPQQQPMVNLQAGTEAQAQESRPFLHSADPYGYNPHLDGLSPVKQPVAAYTTNPKELQKYLEAPQPIAVVTPNTKRLKVLPPTVKKANLFDDAVDVKTTEINFTLKQSAKRLMLRKNDLPEEDNTFIEIESEGEIIPEPSLSAMSPKGRPMFIPPLRLSKPRSIEEYSSSGIHSVDDISQTDDGKSSKSDSTQSSVTNLMMTDDLITEAGDNIEVSLTCTEADTCGVILTRPEYYTVPPLEKLIEHKQGDGQCLVKGFTVGRVGYGNVSFPDLMNIANLDLDDLVHFRYRELTIYPDDSKKPPLGQGLNRRAQVTLDRVFPKGKVDRKLITDVETLTSINFADTLRDLCDKHGTKFLDYRPETGSWVFMVEHFSKYKYSDSDDDDEDTADDTQTKQTAEEEKGKAMQEEKPRKKRRSMSKEDKLRLEQQLLNESVQDIIMDDDDDIMIDDSPLQSDIVMTDISDTQFHGGLAGDYSVDGHFPLGSDFEIETDFAIIPSSRSLHQVKTRRDLYKTSGEQLFLMKATLFEDEDYVPVNIVNDNIETISKTDGRLIKDIAKRPYSKRTIGTVPRNKSLYNCRNYMDMAIFKGRSFKVGWGKGYVLATGSNFLHNVPNNSHLKNRIEILNVTNLTNQDPLMSLSEHLKIILETSEVNLVEGVPLFSVKKTKSGLIKHQQLSRQTNLKNRHSRRLSYYREIWDLLVALWCDITPNQTRRDQLSLWFQCVLDENINISIKEYPKLTKESTFYEIFMHLTGYQLYEAAEVAIRNSLPNLSLLISQMNLSQVGKVLLMQQMEHWRTSLALDHIHISLQKIYMLLSGMLIYEDESSERNKQVNICESLHWRQCLAVIMWYITASTDPISTSIDLYMKAFDEECIARKPTPEHLDEEAAVFDIQYHLMLLHCNKGTSLETILNPLTHTIYASDYRLSWLLLQTLTSLNAATISDNARNIITTSFSMQLESLGLPQWAVFVLLFIKDSSVRKNLVMGSLHRNLNSNTSTQMESELVKELQIPAEWLHEVKSYKTRLLGMHWQSYRHLAYTQLWYDSHKIAVDWIIPDLILNEKFNIMKGILENLEQGEARILNWQHQGGLLLDFLAVMDDLSEADGEIDRTDALKLHSALLDICNRLPYYPMSTSKQIAAISELSKRCYIYCKLLLRYINPNYQGIVMVTDLQLDKLVMPADYIFEDLANIYPLSSIGNVE